MIKAYTFDSKSVADIIETVRWFKRFKNRLLRPERKRKNRRDRATGRRVKAKCQEGAQADGLISVKLLDRDGNVTDYAFDVCVFPDGAATDFTSGYYLAHTGEIMAVDDVVDVFKHIDGKWYMSSVLIKTASLQVLRDVQVSSRKIQYKYNTGVQVIDAGTQYDSGNWQDLHEFVALAAKILHEITVDGPNKKLYEDWTDGIYVFEKGTYDNDDDADNLIHTGSACP